MFRDLFINASLLLSILFVIDRFSDKFIKDRFPPFRLKLLHGLHYGLLGIVLMLFTVRVTDSFILDFRIMAIVLAVLYGGTVTGLTAAVTIGAFRLGLFGIGFTSLTAVVNLLLITLGCLAIRKWYDAPAWRKWSAMTLLGLTTTTATFFVLISDRATFWLITSLYWLFTIVVGVITHSLVLYLEQANNNGRELLKKQTELQQIFDNVDTVIWSWNLRNGDISVSKDIETLVGYPRANFMQDPDFWIEISHPDYREKARKFLEQVMSGIRLSRESQVVRADGTVIWIEEHANPIKDGTGSVVKIISAVQDITARKQSERKLRDSRKHLSTTLDSIGDGVISTDTRGVITYLNPVALDLTGWTFKEAVGRPIESVFHIIQDRTRLTVDNPIYRAIQENRTVDLPQHSFLVNKQGIEIPIDDSAAPIRSDDGTINGAVLVFRDILERKLHEEQIRHYAFHDALTGLPNRRMLYDLLRYGVVNAKRNDETLAVLFLDLDHFKMVNDSLGHDMGDLLLIEVSQQLLKCVRDGDTVARLGGDEFMIILVDPSLSETLDILQRIKEMLNRKHEINGHSFFNSPSIGVSFFPNDGKDAETLIRHADMAMYDAKTNGKNQHRFFTPELHEQMQRKLEIDKGLRSALEYGDLGLEYQPKVDLNTGSLTGFEALVRWSHPQWGPVSPDEFIPVAEESGLIHQLGEWVLRYACRQFSQWLDAGISAGRLAVNLSVKQLQEPDFPLTVKRILKEEGLAPERLELEITETVMKQGDRTVQFLNVLKDMGIYISIDDFGTGYSSLSYLNRMPIDALKIDKTFIHEMTTNAADAEIVTTIITLANSLRLKVIAEGVETKEQLEFLKMNSCHEGQGYLLGRPAPPERVEKLYLPV